MYILLLALTSDLAILLSKVLSDFGLLNKLKNLLLLLNFSNSLNKLSNDDFNSINAWFSFIQLGLSGFVFGVFININYKLLNIL